MEFRRWWSKKSTALLLSTKRLATSITWSLIPKMKGRRHGLVNLYKDMELCSEYTDIQVMWEMLHSAQPAHTKHTYSRSSSSGWRRYNFRPT